MSKQLTHGEVLYFDLDLFKHRVYVFENPRKFQQFLINVNKEEIIETETFVENMLEKYKGMSIKGVNHCIWLKDRYDVMTYLHEISHMIDQVMNHYQIPSGIESTEVRALLTELSTSKYLSKYKNRIIVV